MEAEKTEITRKVISNNTSNIDSYGKNDKKNSAGKEVKNGRSNEEETGRVHRRNNKADEGQDSISQIEKVPMKDNLQIVGTNESFIYESKTDANSDEIVEKVYSIKDGKLSKLPIQSFWAATRQVHSLSNILSLGRRFLAIIIAKIWYRYLTR